MNTTLDTAIRWVQQEISVIPIKPRSKLPVCAWKKYQTTMPTLPQLLKWFHQTENNIAVVCGWNNLVILDFDALPAYCDFVYRHSEFKDSYTVSTARGMHIYVYCPDVPTMMSEDVDVKSNGYCLTYPSVHPSGKRYDVVKDKAIMNIDRLPDECVNTPSTVECDSSVVINNYGSIGTLSVTKNCTRCVPNSALQYSERNDIIGKIKYRVRITDLFKPVRTFEDGRAFAHCPMSVHPNGDRDPSLSLDLKTDRCQCISRSNCPLHSAHGNDVIDAYMAVHNLSFKETLKRMANELGL